MIVILQFKEIFEWASNDKPCINTNIISHKLKIDPTIKPIAKEMRSLTEDKSLEVREEVERILIAGFIKEIRFQI